MISPLFGIEVRADRGAGGSDVGLALGEYGVEE
jgi:hypothetical protein